MVEYVELKRSREEASTQEKPGPKRQRLDSSLDLLSGTAVKESENNREALKKSEAAPRPHPYYYYRDHSQVEDPDPFKPLTPPGRVPNFPAKMMAILSRPEYSDIVSWLDHGRAWKVLKARQFESEVIPKFFEHAKFSSFIRQANGWGFRRITQGKDRNAYYNELFLRGLPHLCKQMKRHGVSEKQTADPDHEPDFYKISEKHPLPMQNPDDESIVLPHILKEGPKARMPVYFHSRKKTTRPVSPDVTKTVLNSQAPLGSSSVLNYSAHPHSPSQFFPAGIAQPSFPTHRIGFPFAHQQTIMKSLIRSGRGTEEQSSVHVSPLLQPAVACHSGGHLLAPNLAQLNPSTAANQYAAGFAVAAAMSNAHFHSLLGHALASIPPTIPK